MPARLEIKINSHNPVTPKGAHAITHELLRSEEDLGKTLHDSQNSLTFPSWKNLRDHSVLRVASPDDTIIRMMRLGLIENEIYVGNEKAQLISATTISRMSWEELLSPQPCKELRLEFTTPTSFKSQGEMLALPVPQLILQSALRITAPWTSAKYAELQAGCESVRLGMAQINTELVEINGMNAFPGFTGQIKLQATDSKGEQLLGFLHNVSEFVHIGAKGAYGLGHCITQRLH